MTQETMKPLYVGLAGMGTVGGGLVQLLKQDAELIHRRTGREIVLRRVLVRTMNPARAALLPEGCTMTTNPADLTDDPEIDVVVELIGGTGAARSLIARALEQGKHIVTANKALLAEDSHSLFELAREKGVLLRYEGSVAGAIPIVETLTGPLAGNRILSLMGILNGTSNYILSEMTSSGLDFGTALKQAQELGYAEADPTLDVDGFDAAHKLILLIRLAFGLDYPFVSMPVQGIRGLDKRDIIMAREFGYRIKLVAEARLQTGDDGVTRLEAGVFPMLVHHTYLLARVGGVYNAVRLEGEASGSLFLHGRGAGALPTAGVVLSDLLAVARGDRPNNTGFANDEILPTAIVPPEEWHSRYYVRVMVNDEPGVLRDLAGCMADEGISMAQVIQKPNEVKVVPLVFMTHEASAQSLNRALARVSEKGLLLAAPVYYRILQ